MDESVSIFVNYVLVPTTTHEYDNQYDSPDNDFEILYILLIFK